MEVHYIKFLGIYPSSTQLVPQVPREIKKDMKEALECLSIGAATAATIMSGRVLESLCKELGIQPTRRNQLGKVLDQLKNTRLIDEKSYKAFLEIKEWRNLGAHQSDQKISFDDAKLVVSLVQQLVQKMFEEDKLAEWQKKLEINRTKNS